MAEGMCKWALSLTPGAYTTQLALLFGVLLTLNAITTALCLADIIAKRKRIQTASASPSLSAVVARTISVWPHHTLFLRFMLLGSSVGLMGWALQAAYYYY